VTQRENMHSTRPIALAIGGSIALASAMGIGRFAYTPILPEMVAALHLSASQAGLIASANFAGYLIGALVAAASVFAPRRRDWMLGALLVSALTTGAMAAGSSLTLFLLLRFLGGFASAFALVFTSSLVLDRLAETGRGHLAGHQFAGVGAGIAISAVLVAQLAAHRVAWQWQWLACAALSVLALAAVAFLIPPRPPTAASSGGSNGATLGGALSTLIIAYGLFGFGYVITATFLVAIVRGSPEIRYLEPVIWIGFGLSAIPSVVVWSALSRVIGTFKTFALACLVEGFGVAASVLIVSTTGVLLATLCLGGTFIAITALGLVGARRLSVADPRRVLALMTVAFGLGQIVGPVLAGALVERSGGYTLPSLIAAATLVVAALLTAPLDRAARPGS